MFSLLLVTSIEESISPPVTLQHGQDILSIRVDQLCPGLPQGVHDVADEPNLRLLSGGIGPVAHRGDV